MHQLLVKLNDAMDYLKTALKARVAGTLKNWDEHLVKATWLVNTGASVNRAGPALSELLTLEKAKSLCREYAREN